MQKVLYVKGDNLDEANHYLSTGWNIERINAVRTVSETSAIHSYAYIVIEKNESDRSNIGNQLS